MPPLANPAIIDRGALRRAIEYVYKQVTNGSDAEVLRVVKAGTTNQALEALDPATTRLTGAERLALALFIVHRDQGLPKADRHDFYWVIRTATIESIGILADENLRSAARRGLSPRLTVGCRY
jgi:hypothetical protein